MKLRSYLNPHRAAIFRMHRQGKTATEIAEALYASGVRSPNLNEPGDGEYLHTRTFASLVRTMIEREREAA